MRPKNSSLHRMRAWLTAARAGKLSLRQERAMEKAGVTRRFLLGLFATTLATQPQVAQANWWLRVKPTVASSADVIAAIQALPTITPSSSWTGVHDLGCGPAGKDANGNLATGAPGTGCVPPEDGVYYGSNYHGKHTTGGFRRMRGDWVTADISSQLLTIYGVHGDRAGTDWIKIGTEGGQVVTINNPVPTPSPINGRIGHQIRVLPPTNAAGEARIWVMLKPVNGRIRVVSIKLTLDGGGLLTPTPLYVGYPGAVDSSAATGTKAASYASVFYALVQAIKHPKWPNLEIVVKNGATIVEDFTVGATLFVPGFNDRRITIRREDPNGPLPVLTRTDRGFANNQMTTMSSTAAGLLNGKPYIQIYSNTGANIYIAPGTQVKNPATGEIRTLVSSAGFNGVTNWYLDAAFSTDFTNIPYCTPSLGLVWPVANVLLSGIFVDAHKIASMNSANCSYKGSYFYGRIMFNGGSKIVDVSGFGGPLAYSDDVPNPPAPYQDGTGYSNVEFTCFFASGGTAGIDGLRATDGTQYNALDGVYFDYVWQINLTYAEDQSGRFAHDYNYFAQSGTARFNDRSRQIDLPRYRAHSAKYLTVDSYVDNGDGTSTITVQESAATAGIFTSSLPGGFGPTAHFITGPLSFNWVSDEGLDDLGSHIGDWYPNRLTSTTVTLQTPKTYAFGGTNYPRTVQFAPQRGDRFVVYTTQHPDVQQWASLGAFTPPVDNIHVQGQCVVGENTQCFYQDSEQVATGQFMDNSTGKTYVSVGGSMTVSGLTATFASTPTLNVGDFVVVGSNYGAILSVNGNAVTLQSDSTLANGTYASWSRETGMQTSGTTATFSSPPCITYDDMLILRSGAYPGTYVGVDFFTRGQTTATISRQLISNDNNKTPFDQTTWCRFQQGKSTIGVAYVATIFETVSKNPQNQGNNIGALEGSTRNLTWIQCTYKPSVPNYHRVGDGGFEDITYLDNVLSFFGGNSSGKYLGFYASNNLYRPNGSSVTGNTLPSIFDTTGIAVSSKSSWPYVSQVQSYSAFPVTFDTTLYNPANSNLKPLGIVRPGAPNHGKLLWPGDWRENYLPGLAASYDSVGARPSLAAA